MSLPVLVLRPEPAASATCATAQSLGLHALPFPLFRMAPVPWRAPPPESCDALLIGSANAILHAGPQLAAFAGKPAYCVGQATAQAALAAGLLPVAHPTDAAPPSPKGAGLQPLLDTLAPQRLLRLSGQTRLDLVAPSGVTITECTTYAAHPCPLPSALARLLLAHALPGALALFHSGEAARHFTAETTRLAIPRARIHALAIGPRVAAIAAQAPDYASLHTASSPTDAALLALAAQICQTSA